MSCIVNPNSALEKTKVDLVNKGAIDQYGKVLKPTLLRELNNRYLNYARDTFDIELDLFGNKAGYVSYNENAFKLIDALKGEFYPENEYLRAYVSDGKFLNNELLDEALNNPVIELDPEDSDVTKDELDQVSANPDNLALEDREVDTISDPLVDFEINVGVRNKDGSKKRYPKKSYKSTLKKVQNLNKAYPGLQFRMITVTGEKGDDRIYDAIETKERIDNRMFSTFSYSKAEVKQDLRDTLMAFLYKVNPNFRVEVLDELNDGNGVSLNGMLKLNEFLIQLKSGKEEALTEEAAHVLVELLDKNSDLYKALMSEVPRSRIYKQVLEDYGNLPSYKGNYEKLKREAAAKLISIYLMDKSLFNYMAGSDSFVENMKRLIQKVIAFIRGKKLQSPFNQAALRMLSLNTDNIILEQASQSEYMYQLNSIDMNYLSTALVQTQDRSLILININEAILNVNSYIPTQKLNKEGKPINPLRTKAKMWFNSDQSELNRFYENAKLTNLGVELKDKWSTVGGKVKFFSNTPVTQSMLDRIYAEFGTNVDVIHINTDAKVDVDLKLISGSGVPIYDYKGTKEKEALLQTIGNKRAVVIDSKKNQLFTDAPDNVSLAVFNDETFQRYEKARTNISRYRTVREVQEEQARAAKQKEFTDETLAEFQRLGHGQILKLSQKALKIVRNLISRIENNESEADLIEMFKDANGNLILPLDKAKKILKQVEEKGQDFEEGLLSFVNTITSVSAFWRNANQTNNYSSLTQYDNQDQLNKNLKEVATLMRFALNWEEYISSLTPLLEDNTFGNMKVIPGMIKDLRDEITNAKAQISKVAVSLMSDLLSNQASDYNKALEIRLKSGSITQKEFDKSVVTPERMANILTGKGGDVSATAYFENGLFVGDDVIQSFTFLLQKTTTVANQKAFLEFMDVNADLQKIMDEIGTTDDQITKEITFEDTVTYYEYEEGTEDNPEATAILKTRKAVSFLQPFKNEYKRDEQFEILEVAKRAYVKAKNADPDSEETKNAKLNFDRAKIEFDRWEKENWNRENNTDPDEIYAEFGLDKELIDRASAAQQTIREEIRGRNSLLKMGGLTLDQQKDITKQIEDLYKQLKDLRNPWDRVNNKMKEESDDPTQDIRIAQILKEKSIIDRQIFEYNVDETQFIKDLNALLAQMPTDAADELRAYINPNDETWLAQFYEAAYILGSSDLTDFLDQNTKVKYSDNFYESRKEIFDEISESLDQLQSFLTESERMKIAELKDNLGSAVEELQNLSSSLRDEDGVFNAYDTTPEHQKVIRDVDSLISGIKEEIKDIKAELTPEEVVIFQNKEEGYDKVNEKRIEMKKLKDKVTFLMNSLMSIQEKNPTDAYNTSIYELLKPIYPDKLGGVFPNENFMDLIADDTFQSWLQEVAARVNSGVASEEEIKFVEWFENNHLFKLIPVGFDNVTNEVIEKIVFSPTYIWMKISPRNSNDVLVVPSHKYTKREYKKAATVEYKDQKRSYNLKNEKQDWVNWNPLTKQWLPKLKGEFVNEEFFKLKNSTNPTDQKKFQYLQKITRYYLSKQLQPDVPREGKMGYILPYVHKRYTEGNALSTLLKQARGLTNPVEEGNVNRSKDSTKIKEGIFKRFLSTLKAWAGIEVDTDDTGDPVNVIKTDFLGNKIQKFNVKYTGYLEPENVSRHGLASVFSYVEGLETTRALIGTAKESNLLLQILEQYQPFEKNTVNQAGERIQMKTNRRLDIVRDLVQKQFYGNFNEYEFGEWVDSATRTLRNYTVGMSQSVLNPSNALKNWLQGQITSMTIGNYKNWTNEKALAKAMADPRTSYVKYITDMRQTNKSLDFQILSMFNLVNRKSISETVTKSGYKMELGIDNIFMMPSQATEFSIVSTLLYSHLFHKDITINGESKKLYDAFTLVDNKLAFKAGSIDPETGKVIDMDYFANLTIKAKVMAEQINNKTYASTFAQRFTLYKNLEFFKSFLIPALRTRFAKKRKNIALGEDLEGYYRTGFRYLIKQMMSLLEHHKLNMVSYTPEEQQAAIILLKEFAVSLALLGMIGFVFGFDDDDEERYQKLKENNWITNFFLLTVLNTKKETDAFSIYPFLNVNNNLTPPIISETWNYVTNPFIGFGAVDKGKKLINAIASLPDEGTRYKQAMPQYYIEKGDTKLEHTFRTLFPIDAFLYIADPQFKIQVTQEAAKRG